MLDIDMEFHKGILFIRLSGCLIESTIEKFDLDVIDFMKTLNLKSYNVVDYEKDSQQFRCEDGQLHSYSFLLNRYLRHKMIA